MYYNYSTYQPNNRNLIRKHKDMKIHIIIFGLMTILLILCITNLINDAKLFNRSRQYTNKWIPTKVLINSRYNYGSTTKRHLDNYIRMDEILSRHYDLTMPMFDNLQYDAYSNQYTITVAPSLRQLNNTFSQAIKNKQSMSKSQINTEVHSITILALIKLQQQSIEKETHNRSHGILINSNLPIEVNKMVIKQMHNKKIIAIMQTMNKYKNKRTTKLI